MEEFLAISKITLHRRCIEASRSWQHKISIEGVQHVNHLHLHTELYMLHVHVPVVFVAHLGEHAQVNSSLIFSVQESLIMSTARTIIESSTYLSLLQRS